jgi:hypothetical protein
VVSNTLGTRICMVSLGLILNPARPSLRALSSWHVCCCCCCCWCCHLGRPRRDETLNLHFDPLNGPVAHYMAVTLIVPYSCLTQTESDTAILLLTAIPTDYRHGPYMHPSFIINVHTNDGQWIFVERERERERPKGSCPTAQVGTAAGPPVGEPYGALYGKMGRH